MDNNKENELDKDKIKDKDQNKEQEQEKEKNNDIINDNILDKNDEKDKNKNECKHLHHHCCEISKMYSLMASKLEKMISQNQSITKNFEEYKQNFNKQLNEHKDRLFITAVEDTLKILDVVETVSSMILVNEASEKLNVYDLSIINAMKVINQQINFFLEDMNVQVIKPIENEQFDANNHIIIDAVQKKEDQKSNQIIRILRNGYRFKNYLIRPASVIVCI